MVSPQNCVLITTDKTWVWFEKREILVAVSYLMDMDGIDVSRTTYIHIMSEQHAAFLSDDPWIEGFHTGDMSPAGVGDASGEEKTLELFPECATREGIEANTGVRKSLEKHNASLSIKKSQLVSIRIPRCGSNKLGLGSSYIRHCTGLVILNE